MIIPVRCFTCGKVIADKWNAFEKEKSKIDEYNKHDDTDTDPFTQKHNYGTILDNLNITKICCRRHMLGHVNLIDII